MQTMDGYKVGDFSFVKSVAQYGQWREDTCGSVLVRLPGVICTAVLLYLLTSFHASILSYYYFVSYSSQEIKPLKYNQTHH